MVDKVQIATGSGGAASVGMALATIYTHAPDVPYTDVDKTIIGLGIGAVIAYFVLWLEMVRIRLGGAPRNKGNEKDEETTST